MGVVGEVRLPVLAVTARPVGGRAGACRIRRLLETLTQYRATSLTGGVQRLQWVSVQPQSLCLGTAQRGAGRARVQVCQPWGRDGVGLRSWPLQVPMVSGLLFSWPPRFHCHLFPRCDS